MIEEFDDTQCQLDGCDQGLHNYLLYSGKLMLNATQTTTINITDPATDKLAVKIVELKSDSSHRIQRIEYYTQGYGMVNTLGLFCGFRKRGSLRSSGLLKDNKDKIAPLVLNWDGLVSPVIHQIDRCSEISAQMDLFGDQLWESWVLHTEENQLLEHHELLVETKQSIST